MKKQKILIPVVATIVALSSLAFGGSQAMAQTGTKSEIQTVNVEAKPFTATTGLETFSSYRMNLGAEFDGFKDGQPSSGSLDGFLDVVKEPKAQHLRVDVQGDTFADIAPLGTIEAFDVNSVYYAQNPQNGSWLTVPAFLVNTMLPDGVPSPEETIQLPATAVRQPGTEMINGVITQQYTFTADNMAVEYQANEIEGTIWVAVVNNTVVKYQATISGQFADAAAEAEEKGEQITDFLGGGNLSFIDEGTITMGYELTDVNETLSITLPDGVGGFNLLDLLW